jgi:hypothetical protein
MTMPALFLPFIAGPPKRPAFGYAFYGAHKTLHAQLTQGLPCQNWGARACCLGYPSYLPTMHSTLWLPEPREIAQLAEQYPRRTWLLLNEPDMPPPQAFIRPDYAKTMIEQWVGLLEPYGHRIAGYGVTITDQAHWTSTYAADHPQAWNTIGWRKWLDDWNTLHGPTPAVAHIHIYAKTRQAWQDQYAAWKTWNRANWQAPTIISECGESPDVWAYLRDEFADTEVEALLWFTNFTDNVLPGLPELES